MPNDPATSTPTTRQCLHRQPGNVYIDNPTSLPQQPGKCSAGCRNIIDVYKPANNPTRTLCLIKTTSSTNQDLPHDSACHPKAQGLLSWIWDTGTCKESERGPSGGSSTGQLHNQSRTRTHLAQLVIEEEKSLHPTRTRHVSRPLPPL